MIGFILGIAVTIAVVGGIIALVKAIKKNAPYVD